MSERENARGVSRRNAIRLAGAAGAMMLSARSAWARGLQDLPDRTAVDLDHLVWGVPDLEAGIALLAAKTGIKAVFGGVHPGRGTRNALLSLGKRQYLEILAPDPDQQTVQSDRVAELRRLTTPRMLTWAAAARDIEAVSTRLQAAGFETSGAQAGARTKADGTVLKWKSLSVSGQAGDVVPFMIEWDAASSHPSSDSPAGCTARALRLEHPDPVKVNRLLEALGLRVRATQGPQARLTALLSTPKGDLVLT